VANARELRGIWGATRKNDRRDAGKLARYARLDPALLHPTRVRSEEAQLELSQLRVRDALVRARTLLVNAARGLSKTHGKRLAKTSTKSFAVRAAADLKPELRNVLEPLLSQIAALSERIRAADRAARQAAERSPSAARLMTVPGVGPLTALTFVHTLEDPGRFRRSREVGPYLGLTPRQAQSGSRDPQLPISKAGDVRLRRLLVQCAHRILGPFGLDSSLRRWAQQLASRGGPAGRKRAIVGLARKLAVVLHRLWTSEDRWRPFPAAA
jgi:transposase